MEDQSQSLLDIHNKILNHLLTQNGQSFLPHGTTCAYRGIDGKMCAVGCLISDEYYNPSFEEWLLADGKNGEIFDAVIKSTGWVGNNEQLLKLLQYWQTVHDDYPTTINDPRHWSEYIMKNSNDILNMLNLN